MIAYTKQNFGVVCAPFKEVCRLVGLTFLDLHLAHLYVWCQRRTGTLITNRKLIPTNLCLWAVSN